MRLRNKVRLEAFRDIGQGGFDAVREYSEPLECWANIEARAFQRFVDGVNAFGRDRTVSHTATIRPVDMDVFTHLYHGENKYRVFETQMTPCGKYMVVGLIFEKQEDAGRGMTVFNA